MPENTEEAAAPPPDWGYWGAGAPNNWGSLSPEFALCAVGIAQPDSEPLSRFYRRGANFGLD